LPGVEQGNKFFSRLNQTSSNLSSDSLHTLFFASLFTVLSDMPKQQTVYRVTGHGSLDDSKKFQEDIPAPTRYEVLIEIKALSLNYRDTVIANSTYPFGIAPNVCPISDCAAVVSVLGEGVDASPLETRLLSPLMEPACTVRRKIGITVRVDPLTAFY
jgi:hypothetical protein